MYKNNRRHRQRDAAFQRPYTVDHTFFDCASLGGPDADEEEAGGGAGASRTDNSSLAGENRSIHAIRIRSTTLPTEVMAGRASM